MGKKKKKKSKKKKEKKKKPLPGEKIAEIKGFDTDQMLSCLIEKNLVVKTSNRKVSDFVGEFNYLGSMHQHAERNDDSKWIPQDPSLAQIRQSVIEYCILPNGSPELKSSIPPERQIKSIMFYGPSGTGKTLMVEAIDPTMQPCIIYFDDCEHFCKKSKDKEGAFRFKKDLDTYMKQALSPEHRVIVIGTTKFPENGDMKEMKKTFDKYLYFPYPDYPSRVMLWKHFICQQIEIAVNKQIELQRESGEKVQSKLANLALIDTVKKTALETVNLSSLGQISEGYSAGYIARTVRTIVTDRRVQTLHTRPLRNVDFLDNLAIQEVTYLDDKKTFLSFLK